MPKKRKPDAGGRVGKPRGKKPPPPGGRGKGQTDAAMVARRMEAVLVWYLSGARRAEMWQHVATANASKDGKDKSGIYWRIQPRTLDRYIAKVKEQAEEAAVTVRQRELGRALLRLDSLYLSNLEIQDYKECRAVVKERNALLGLYEPLKVDATVNGVKAYIGFDPEEI